MKSTCRAIQSMSDGKKILLGALAFIIFHSFLHLFVTVFLHAQQCQILPLVLGLWSLPGGLFLVLVLAERPDIPGLTLFSYLLL